MTNNKEHIGILGYGLYIPETFVTAAEIASATDGAWTEENIIKKLGIVRKPIPGPEDGTQRMGALAAQDAICRTGIDPKEIDLILCVGEEWKEYGMTTSALFIQDQIGATNAWGIDIANRCCTTCSALKIAKDIMKADSEVSTVLIAGGYRNGDWVDYKDKNMSMMYNLGAGGGAFILRKGMTRNLVLGSHIIADGSLALTAGAEIGGIKNPFTPDNIDEGYKSLRLLDSEKMKSRLNEVSIPNWYRCIDESLKKSGGLTRKDIDYLGILHFKRSQHEMMLEDLGLIDEQTVYLEQYGHIGQVDQMLTIDLGLSTGKIKDGGLVVLIAAGIGYVWASTCIRWGR